MATSHPIQQSEPEPERSAEGFETMLVEKSNAPHDGIDNVNVDIDYHNHRSNSLALPTSFRLPSNSNHAAHGDDDEEDDDYNDNDVEAVAATATANTFGAIEGDGNEPTSSTRTFNTVFHRHRFQGKMNHPPWSLVFILSLAISGGVGYKYWQLQSENEALKNELRLKSTMLAALPSTSEVKEKQMKKKGTKAPKVEVECASSAPSVRVSTSPSNSPSQATCSIVDLILEGDRLSLDSTDRNTVIVGKGTSIVGSPEAVLVGDGGRVDIHEGTFDGDLQVQPGGTANVYGGEWKSFLYTVGGCDDPRPPPTLNLYLKDLRCEVSPLYSGCELCDGSPISTLTLPAECLGSGRRPECDFCRNGTPISTPQVASESCVSRPNYLPCPQDYQVPTFPECE